MKITCNREKIGDGIHFTEIINGCQKTNTVIVHLVTELSPETASLNAIIPYVLSNSSDEYRTVTELSRKLNGLYGANLRGVVSKIGDSQVVSLMSGCVNDRYTFDGEKITEEMTRVLLGCLTSPYVENGGFFEGDFLLKKQELLDDIDAEINDKRSFAFKQAGKIIYKDEPCAISARGERAYAEKVTASEAYEQYKKLIATAQVEISFVGAERLPGIKEMFVKAFSEIKRSFGGNYSTEFSAIKKETVRLTEHYDVAQSKMVMAFKTDCRNDSAMRLMNSVFGGTPFSKLFLNVREKLSLCYYCSSGYNDRKGVLYVDSGVEQENIEKAEAEILNQLKAVCRGEFTDEEVENSRLSIINGLRGVNDSARSIAEWYFKHVYGGNMLSPEEEIERICAVTREDIIAAAEALTLDTVYVLTGKEREDE